MNNNVNNIKFNFNTPLIFSQDFLAKEKPLTKALIIIGSWADHYVHLGKNFHTIKGTTVQELPIKGHAWKTALKIISYFLTAFILPSFALIAKTAYKIWAFKNIPYMALSKPVRRPLPSPLQLPLQKLPDPIAVVKHNIALKPLAVPPKIEFIPLREKKLTKNSTFPKPRKKPKPAIVEKAPPLYPGWGIVQNKPEQKVEEEVKKQQAEKLEVPTDTKLPEENIILEPIAKKMDAAPQPEENANGIPIQALKQEENIAPPPGSLKDEQALPPATEQKDPKTPQERLSFILNPEADITDAEKLFHLFELEKLNLDNHKLDTLTAANMKKLLFPESKNRKKEEILLKKQPGQFFFRNQNIRPKIPEKFISLSYFVDSMIDNIIQNNLNNRNFLDGMERDVKLAVVERRNKNHGKNLNPNKNSRARYRTDSGREMYIVQIAPRRGNIGMVPVKEENFLKGTPNPLADDQAWEVHSEGESDLENDEIVNEEDQGGSLEMHVEEETAHEGKTAAVDALWGKGDNF